MQTQTQTQTRPNNVINFTSTKKSVQERNAPVGRFMRIFRDIDMRLSHDGLAMIAARGNQQEKGIKVGEMKDGQFCLFLNRACDRFKVYAPHGVVAYLRVKTGRVDLNTIQLIPKAFNGGRIDYDKLLERRITDHLRKRGRLLEPVTQRQSQKN